MATNVNKQNGDCKQTKMAIKTNKYGDCNNQNENVNTQMAQFWFLIYCFVLLVLGQGKTHIKKVFFLVVGPLRM